MSEPASGHDIFISYASEDRDKAQQLAAALEEQGWRVWWDRTIPAGQTFAKVIDKALADSRCVVAMWSATSVDKNWVLEEAQDGLDREILVPVLIEEVTPPRGFRRIQAADLSDWDGSASASQFLQFVEDISHILGPTLAKEAEARSRAEERQRAERDQTESDMAPHPLPRREESTGETAPSEIIAEQAPKSFKWRWPLASVLVIVALVAITWLVDKVSPSVKEEKTAVDDSPRLVEHERIAAAEVARLTNEARAALEVGDYATALERAEAALEKQPENAELLTMTAALNKEIEAARMAAAEKAERAEEVARLRALARIQSESADYEGALVSIEAALELTPEDNELETLRSEVAERQRASLEQRISQDVSRLVGEARADQAAGKPQAGVEKIEQALALTPEDQELERLREELQAQHHAALIERGLKLRLEDRLAVQQVLSALRFDTRGIDGIFGPSTRRAISDWQRSRDDEVTGYLSAPQYDALLSEADRTEMVDIPAGSFQMSGTAVDVARFGMSRFEVTFDQYDAFARATGRELPEDEGWGRGTRPVINVSWNEATAYAEWLSEQTGNRYRLPTEVEWEYAARAGTDTTYWWGDAVNEDDKAWANCDGCGSQWDNEQTAPVGSFPANGFGLYDTSGNVWEWVQDCWKNNCGQRVIRGGSWGIVPNWARSASRYGSNPENRGDGIGFRLAQDM